MTPEVGEAAELSGTNQPSSISRRDCTLSLEPGGEHGNKKKLAQNSKEE